MMNSRNKQILNWVVEHKFGVFWSIFTVISWILALTLHLVFFLFAGGMSIAGLYKVYTDWDSQ